jgi:hypothetical protein
MRRITRRAFQIVVCVRALLSVRHAGNASALRSRTSSLNAEAVGTLHNTPCPTNALHDENVRST